MSAGGVEPAVTETAAPQGGPTDPAPSAARRPVVLFPYVGGDDVGGSHISSLKLVASLAEDGAYDPVVGLHRPEGALAALVQEMGLAFEAIPERALLEPYKRGAGRDAARSPLSYAGHVAGALTGVAPRLARFLKTRGVSIVHTNDGRIHTTWAVAARLAGKRLVWHHRADPRSRGVNYIAPLLADRILTVSGFAKPRKPIVSVARKLAVNYSPFEPPAEIDRAAARERVLAELGLPPETRLIGTAGVLVQRKRPFDLVDVVKHLRDARPDLPVAGLVLGAPPADAPPLDAQISARAAELGVTDAIHLMGFRKPVEPYMAALDALIVPAMNEPFGRTLIEAMQIGTVVAAYDHGGNPEAIDHGRTGFLIEPLNPKAFVEPVLSLLCDAAVRDKMGAAAKAHTREKFTRERHLQGVLEVYDAILGRGATA